jgi:hypothetical protein
MGYSFYPLETLPKQYDVVWCLYPESGLMPGPIARPSLVLDVRVNQQQKIGGVICTYGTGQFKTTDFETDLITLGSEYEALGLHKMTRFALGLNSRMNLPWCSEFFVSQTYLKAQNIIAGSLTDIQIKRMLTRLSARGLKPYSDSG